MPEINAIKQYQPQSYYHVYNRGVNKQDIFYDDSDFKLFMSLLSRYLSNRIETANNGRPYPNFYRSIQIVGYCLMSNHFHLLVHVSDKPRDLAALMQAHQVAFVRIYNQKYGRVGHLFQSRYKARLIDSDEDLQNTFDYIHKNPGDEYLDYRYSSVHYYPSEDTKAYIPRSVLEN